MADAYKVKQDTTIPRAVSSEEVDGETTYQNESVNYGAGDYVLEEEISPPWLESLQSGDQMDEFLESVDRDEAEKAPAERPPGLPLGEGLAASKGGGEGGDGEHDAQVQATARATRARPQTTKPSDKQRKKQEEGAAAQAPVQPQSQEGTASRARARRPEGS
jgi:hypothetical protein